MNRYPYLLIEVGGADPEIVAAELFELGATGVEERDNTTLDPGTTKAANASPNSELGTILLAHFEEEKEASEALQSLQPPLRGVLAYIEGDAWRDAWKKFFRPIRVGTRLWVRPPWEDVHVQDDEVILTMDPGRAFGSGMHETTQLVLNELEQRLQGEERILDVGTGSGILAIAALLLGAKEVVGTEIDKDALRIARENAEINGVATRLQLRPAEALDEIASRQSFPMVLANIERKTLIPMAETLARSVAPGGLLILSGVLQGEEEEVCEAFVRNMPVQDTGAGSGPHRTPLRRIHIARAGEWCALVFQRLEAATDATSE